jgi:radical SAM protein with 4Fe4S-binding SPASM domain
MVTVTTNGSPVTRRVADRLVHSGLDAIWFSFNGATKATFETIMGIDYDRVRRNLEYLLSVRPASLQVFVNMVETTEMRDEIDENIRYWISRGVGAGSSPLVNRGGNVENYGELNYMPRAAGAVRVCELPYYKMYVLYNGDVVLCCMDWRRTVVLGNLEKESLRQIWNGERYQHVRRLLEEGRSGELELCGTCSYCLH